MPTHFHVDSGYQSATSGCRMRPCSSVSDMLGSHHLFCSSCDSSKLSLSRGKRRPPFDLSTCLTRASSLLLSSSTNSAMILFFSSYRTSHRKGDLFTVHGVSLRLEREIRGVNSTPNVHCQTWGNILVTVGGFQLQLHKTAEFFPGRYALE